MVKCDKSWEKMIKHLLEYVIDLNSYRVFFCRFSPFKYSVRYFVRKEPCKIMIIFCHTYFSATEILDLFISDLSIRYLLQKLECDQFLFFWIDLISFLRSFLLSFVNLKSQILKSVHIIWALSIGSENPCSCVLTV